VFRISSVDDGSICGMDPLGRSPTGDVMADAGAEIGAIVLSLIEEVQWPRIRILGYKMCNNNSVDLTSPLLYQRPG